MSTPEKLYVDRLGNVATKEFSGASQYIRSDIHDKAVKDERERCLMMVERVITPENGWVHEHSEYKDTLLKGIAAAIRGSE